MKRRSALLVLATIATLLAVVPAHAADTCAGPAAGGEWPSYGGSLYNTRTQAEETSIKPETAGNLSVKYFVTTTQIDGAGGIFSNTPAIADGCLFGATSTGLVFAVNADTGKQVWKNIVPGKGQSLLGGVIVGSPAVSGGKVYVGVSDPGNPYVAAFDEFTGDLLWTSVVEGSKIGFPQANALINASVLVTPDGLVFQGFSGNEGGAPARGGFTVLDANDGSLIAHTYTISEAEYAAGYRGASVWCSPAYDAATKTVFACGGNPASKDKEARYTNALLKIDLDRSSPNFALVVDAYKGNPDQYYPGLDHQPACETNPNVGVVWSVTCLQLDLDFGASPTLFRDSLDKLMVGDLQKSGIYHAVYADHMEGAWTAPVAPPCFACNSSSPAVDGSRIYTIGTPPSELWSFGFGGKINWTEPIGDPTVHYQPISTANGVVFIMDGLGFLNAYDAANGLPLLKHNLSLDASAFAGDANSSAGIAIARNKVYVAHAGYIFVLGL